MDTLFWIASKTLDGALRCEVWLLALLLWMGWALWQGHLAAARRRCALLLVLGAALSILPLGEQLLRALESRHPPRDDLGAGLGQVAGMVVLGGGERAGQTAATGLVQLNEAGDRFTAALALARHHPQARLLFTGGNGRLSALWADSPAEASVAALLFHRMGVAPDRLLLEDTARNTAENARLSHALARPQEGEVWLLVTSAFHMPRALASFARAGWPDIHPYPVDHRADPGKGGLAFDPLGRLGVLNLALREWVGLWVYRWTGR